MTHDTSQGYGQARASRYFPVSGEEPERQQMPQPVRGSSIERGLQTMLQSKDNITQCPNCGCRRLNFVGLGEYVCTKCGNSTFSNYGKVRAYLETNGTGTIRDVCEHTGLTRAQIQELIDSNSISVVGGHLWT